MENEYGFLNYFNNIANIGSNLANTFGNLSNTEERELYDKISFLIDIPGVMDILDYNNTNKYKTFRILSGYDGNGTGGLQLNSGLWQSSSAITSIKIEPNTSTFQQYSTFSLYGIKRAGA